MSSIAARLDVVRRRIADACASAGRDPGSVRLVAVSKFHAASAIREAYAAGQCDFGENYAQELAEKHAALQDLPDLRFRFIGALQRNKVKMLLPQAQVIETLASLDAARTISGRAAALGIDAHALVQVNVSAEPQKSGVAPAALAGLLHAMAGLAHLSIDGLMAIPAAADPAAARASYAELRRLRDAAGLRELSMGMSDDLEIAIAEGATSVRVGTAIFGPRP
jgi:pyridoxal phosphate enzyme (YggS family)